MLNFNRLNYFSACYLKDKRQANKADISKHKKCESCAQVKPNCKRGICE